MSETPSTTLTPPPQPPPPPPPAIADPHQIQPHQFLHTHNATTSASTSAPTLIREYRKGNWNLEETLTLITAKKLDDERRLMSNLNSQDPTKAAACRASGELRWKWVENYCWSHGCFRSQNQCNDKWDNLLRDYKKVRDYESKSDSSQDFISYWSMDKHRRKQSNLPSNMLFDVHQAINDVLQRKFTQRTVLQAHPSTMAMPSTAVAPPSPTPPVIQQPPQSLPPPSTAPPPPPPPPTSPPHTQIRSSPELEAESSGTEESDENEDSETKRRKVRNIGSSIMRSASVLARALESCEEKKERRHGEVIELERRRLQMEESRNEIHKHGIENLVAAVTNLSGAIQSLISDRHGRR